MLNPLFDITHLKNHIAAGGLVLTANQRLARSLLDAWGQYCQHQGMEVWRQPPVYALDDWFAECWRALLDRGYQPALIGGIANPHAERWLWQQVIATDEASPDGDPAAYAELARDAWQSLQLWQVPLRQLEHSNHEGCQHLLRWFDGYRKALAQRALITREQAVAIIGRGFGDGVLIAPAAIRLVGFQTLPPLYRAILGVASARVDDTGNVMEVDATESAQSLAMAATLDDDNSEILAAARWAKAQLENGTGTRIGVVFPNLTRIRSRVERVFRDQLTPAHGLPGSGHAPPPFNISAGVPLARTPLVASALNLLALQSPEHPLPYYCQLLTDPFWGDADSELASRARAEVALRELGKIAPSSADCRHQVQRGERDGLDSGSRLSARLQQFADSLRHQPASASLRDWATHFSAQLGLLGWPVSRTLDSIEFQQLQHWRDLLDQFAALADIAGKVTAGQALAQLRQMAVATPFQAQTADAPVQVLGLLEAVGLRFDRLWVAGMDDSQWPQPPAPNPLLPIALQRQHGLPRSSAEHELALARALFDGLRHSASGVVFSYARRDGDSERLPSALLQGLPPWPAPVADAIGQPLIAELLGSTELERVPLDTAPAVVPTGATFRGGSSVLQDQAGCPFNAFAIWRLGATPLPEPGPGLSAQERGTLVHRCLELLWTRLKTQAALMQLDADAGAGLLAEIIDEALKPWRRERPDLFGTRFTRLESARLQTLLSAWLAIDRERAAFSVIAPEQAISVDIGGLTLSLRIDRIDQLADGSLVLIDYKTGATDPRVWSGERPEEPQLPLYALSVDAPVVALCLARVSGRNGVKLSGTGGDSALLPGLIAPAAIGLPESWPDTLAHWRRVLDQLAREFLGGHAELCFYTRTARDRQGHLLPLNRWPEWTTLRALETAP